ncbi:MAG TPA: oxidoreductase [Streptomyces sp.]|jgi:NAD(P)-dependent dehydrogenase (short-subunit alcohol dehydrogenase family)|nr:oxidoreductase [Streptomyces sp.]
MGWTARDIPDQSGRTAVVTGANSGLGYVTARELARRGARVVLGCRSEQRGRAALERLRSEVPEAAAELRPLDLADLSSVRAFADGLPDERIDVLVNNAGLMAVPYALTADGFEMQFGVNHLGHFALTGLLLDRLLAAEAARVVNVSSLVHLIANIDPEDLNSEHGYHAWVAYGRSKSANLLFTHELARRAAPHGITVAAAHPGYASTELQTKGPRLAGRRAGERLMALANTVFASSPELGAAPSLYAATAPSVIPGSFTGPRLLGVRGTPGPARQASWTRNDTAARRLWDASVQLTGVSFGALE